MKTLHGAFPRFVLSVLLVASPAMVSCTRNTTNPLEKLQEAQFTPPPQTTAIKMTGYVPPTGHAFKAFFVSNFSVKAMKGQLLPVTSRDGMPDVLKQAHTSDYGFQPTGPNSANPMFGDLLLYLAGIVNTQQSLLYCGANLTLSSSNDALVYTDNRVSPPVQQFLGLRDCEKMYLGLNPNLFDFDGDGIPDYLELRCGINPKNPNDASLSIGGDGVTNMDKCKRNIPIDESANSQANALFAYQYVQELQQDGTTNFTVSNIPILNDGQDNFVAFYLTEVNTATLQTYLYTAFAILKAGSTGKTYNFVFWGLNPANAQNQEVIF